MKKHLPVSRCWLGLCVMVFLAMGSTAYAQFYPDQVRADHPVSYWRFSLNLDDDLGGNNMDPSVSPQFANGPGTGTRAFSTTAGRAWAAAFGAVDLFDLTSYTYEMWIKVRATGSEGRYILMRRTGATEGPGENSIRFNYTPGVIEFYSSHNEFGNTPPSITLGNDTNWHHIAFVYDEDIPAVIAYLDGQEVNRQVGFLDFLLPGHDEEIYLAAVRTAIGQHLFHRTFH